MVIISAYLHDIGRDLVKQDNHASHGSSIVKEILKEMGYAPEIIEQVSVCIRMHNSNEQLTINAEIVRNADAMTNIKYCLVTVAHGFQINEFSFPKTLHWIHEKIERNWNEKLTLPEARKEVTPYYEAFKTLINGLSK